MLKIYNSLSKQKEIFKPIVPGKVGIYVCGITVYDYCHIGHARTSLSFDVMIRYLRYRGYEVKSVRNITDIDDKIIFRALENKEPFEAVTERFIQAMEEDERALNILPYDVVPRATQYIDQMIRMIQQLLDKGYAYLAANGDVYYDVQKFESYGCLSHRVLEDLQAGSRVDINEAKQSPLDFVLWKAAKPGEPEWPSPWGLGRPGWHTECSAMSLDELGETFDIHGGGADLKFPHHENERAQSEAITGKRFVNMWIHTGFLQINKEKMSKSLGNFLRIRDFLKNYDGEILRYFTIASHYRSPVDYSEDSLDAAKSPLERLYTALRGLPIEDLLPPSNTEFEQRFQEAMDDDFNTPVALSVLFDIAREINRIKNSEPEEAQTLGALLKKLGGVLGLLHQDPVAFLHHIGKAKVDAAMIETLIQQRDEARMAKNWAESDKIRDKLTSLGVILEDTASGTLWRLG